MKTNSVIRILGLKVKPEIDEKFSQWLTHPNHPMLKFPGLKMVTHYKITQPDENYPNYLVISVFESQQACEEFMTSPEHDEQEKYIAECWREERPWELKWRVTYGLLNAWKK